MDCMVIIKGWNPNRKLELLEERENQATIQAIEEKFNHTGPTLIPSGSQGVNQPEYPVDSSHSGSNILVTNSYDYLQSQVVSRRRQGYKGKEKTSFIDTQDFSLNQKHGGKQGERPFI
ncbi:hypothetical protein O181_001239 [Austropuccinia psidii MF-1]|uniref:Uncharacterized protein n=1 Tax=Austropuccinia psidii MF-1 TaxID=1389203 RepID=A0A9Q3BA43_9BASI|nr:hypothetical protein [Austropuccinia psidii MF-1]